MLVADKILLVLCHAGWYFLLSQPDKIIRVAPANQQTNRLPSLSLCFFICEAAPGRQTINLKEYTITLCKNVLKKVAYGY